MRKIEGEPYFLDTIGEIKKERDRLQKIVSDRTQSYHEWIPKWLAKSDEEHLEDWDGCTCNICGKRHRYLLVMDFSFCGDYGCDMKICKNCLSRLPGIYIEGMKKVFLLEDGSGI